MKIYIRKLFNHDITHEVSVTKDIVSSFFDGKVSDIFFTNALSNKKYRVSINSATDPRFGGDFKSLLQDLGGCKEDDLLKIDKLRSSYALEIIRPDDERYSTFISLFSDRDRHAIFEMDDHAPIEENDDSNKNQTDQLCGYNKIFYGIPGCGKSYHIEHVVLNDVDKEHDVFRTTFYLDYSNSDFVGQIYPVVTKDDDGKDIVTYKAIPGPFTKALERAYTTPEKMIYLVVEEINRGNAAAIFGDLFQLLDRLDNNWDGRIAGDSEYPISNEFIEGYFKDKGVDYVPGKIFIPHNLTILATMNTSDQNVFPLDTAFKRRWDRERIVTEWATVHNDFKNRYVPFTPFTWEQFATSVNAEMLKYSEDGLITEDKQLGPYFINKSMLSDYRVEQIRVMGKDDQEKEIKHLKRFMNNVIDYLYSDVTKFDHKILFEEKYKNFDDIYDAVLAYAYNPNDAGAHKLFGLKTNIQDIKQTIDDYQNDESVEEENYGNE